MDLTESRPVKVSSGSFDPSAEEGGRSVPRGPVGLKPGGNSRISTQFYAGGSQAGGAASSAPTSFSQAQGAGSVDDKTLGDDQSGQGAPGIVAFDFSHAHVQWRMIAEVVSELLTPDFVDIVFKVRANGNGESAAYLAAHRVLIAAAWPSLREELKCADAPALEQKVRGLSWIDMPSVIPITPHSAIGDGSPNTQPGDPPQPLAGQSPANVQRSSSKQWVGGGEVEVSPVATPSAGSLDLGTFDLTSRPWGSQTIVQALLCHLYGRPAVISELDLPTLRKAAQGLGCSELVKCCEEKNHRVLRRNISTRASLLTTELAEGLIQGGVSPSQSIDGGAGSAASSAPKVSPHAGDEGSITLPSPSVSRVPSRQLEHKQHEAVRGTPATSSREELQGGASASGPADHSQPRPGDVVRVSSRPEAKRSFINEKERSSNFDQSNAHQVLSEIKRNIVESSRIIADKTFQQIYEMVAGERGVLGEGINGPVRMAKHRKTGREVAVKRITCVNLSEQRRQMLVSEIRIFLQVSHRNIVQLLEVYESEVDQAVLLVMELCTGGELFERLALRHWYSEFDAARVTRHMLDAVSYLHSQNICHRDLKLENWLYENPSQDAKLKLCDFGFGQIVEPSVKLTATLGSLFYVAPEVLDGSYGLPCDVWSVGVIVYMLLSGIPPFDGKTDLDVMSKIKSGRFVSTGKRWETVSETAKHFIRCMLRKDPYERLTSAEAAQHAWLKMECQPKSYGWPKGVIDMNTDHELPINRKVIEDMWKFAQNNAITRAALGLLNKLCTSAFGGREEDVLALEQRFRSYDEDSTGKIDAEVFIKVLKETLQISSAEEKQFFERIAGNLPGKDDNVAGGEARVEGAVQKSRKRRDVNYSDFITLTKARRMANNTAAIREAFRGFDEIGDGYINQEELHRLLGDQFKTTIDNYVDVNGKECIDYVHFANTISQEMAKQDATEVQVPAVEMRNRRSNSAASIEGSEQFADKQTPAHSSPRCSNEPVPPEPSVTTAGDAEGKEEEDEEEEPDPDADAGAQSDEEQLVNVQRDEDWSNEKDGSPDPNNDEQNKPDSEKKPQQLPPGKGNPARFQSFSLSLAGSSEYDDVHGGEGGISRVMSMPSDSYCIRQLPGFHSRILRPFYAARPVSNVVMGLIRGTSLYAKQSVSAKLATIIHTTCGWFFLMPNPKYHGEVDTRKGLLSKESGKFRFVAWWIHPRFVPQTRQWFERLTYEGIDQTRQEQRREARAAHESKRDGGRGSDGDPKTGVGEASEGSRPKANTDGARPKAYDPGVGGPGGPVHNESGQGMPKREDPFEHVAAVPGVGNPGDFQFSDVPKPENYLHTYRDLHSKEHVNMLTQLNEGTQRFLRSLFDDSFVANATISAGFHYPVRTQYATLHMQLRVNSGSVCRDDGRGIEINHLIENMKRNRHTYEKDDEVVRYNVTENVKVSLLAAANEYEEQNPGDCASTPTGPLAFDLGRGVMPTIQDDDQEEETDADADPESKKIEYGGSPTYLHQELADPNVVSSYLVNLQPRSGTDFHRIIYKRRARCAELYGKDPTYLYPLHVSVTGFFEAQSQQVAKMIALMAELLRTEITSSSPVCLGEVISTPTGYVLFDVKAPGMNTIAQQLAERAERDCDTMVRPKAVNHISLASKRSESNCEEIRSLYALAESDDAEDHRAYANVQFDLVLSRLLARSSFEFLDRDGPHSFLEVARMPIGQEEALKTQPAALERSNS